MEKNSEMGMEQDRIGWLVPTQRRPEASDFCSMQATKVPYLTRERRVFRKQHARMRLGKGIESQNRSRTKQTGESEAESVGRQENKASSCGACSVPKCHFSERNSILGKTISDRSLCVIEWPYGPLTRSNVLSCTRAAALCIWLGIISVTAPAFSFNLCTIMHSRIRSFTTTLMHDPERHLFCCLLHHMSSILTNCAVTIVVDVLTTLSQSHFSASFSQVVMTSPWRTSPSHLTVLCMPSCVVTAIWPWCHHRASRWWDN